MKNLLSIILLLLLPGMALQAQLAVTPSAHAGFFGKNETPSFKVTGQSGSATYDLYYDPAFYFSNINTTKIGTGNVPGNGVINVPTSIGNGIVFCKVTQSNGSSATSSLAFNPGEIAPKSTVPSDFYSFWNTQANNAGKRLNGTTLPYDDVFVQKFSNSNYTLYEFSIRFRNNNNDNSHLNGLISIPNGSGTFPTILKFPSYGDDPVAKQSFDHGGVGYVYINLSIHETPYEGYGDIRDLSTNYNRENVYYKHVILGATRLIDFLNERTDFQAGGTKLLKVNSDQLFIAGESQGGVGTIIGGLNHMLGDKSVKGIAASKPGFGEMQVTEAQNTVTRATSFPRRWNWTPWNVNPSNATTLYYNAPYFLEYFDGSMYCDMGFLDDICPAAGAYSSVNATRGNNVIVNKIKETHSSHNEFYDSFYRYFSSVTPISGVDPNPYPTSSAGPDIPVSPNASFTINGLVLDNNGAAIPNTSEPTDQGNQLRFQKYRWEFIDCLNGACGGLTPNTVLGNSSTLTHSFSGEGEYLLRFSVNDIKRLNNDDVFLTLRDHVKVTVGTSSGQPQSITFNAISDKLTTSADFNLSASASSNLPVSFSIVSGPANISGNTVSLTGAVGMVTVQASQAGNATYNAAPNVNRSFQVAAPGGGCGGGGGGGQASGCGVTVSIAGLTVSFVSSSNTGEQIIKVRNASWSVQEELCNTYTTNACNSSASISVPSAGSYIVDVQNGGNCTFPITIDGSGGSGPGDADNDGVCDDVDCDNTDPNIGAQQPPGTSCDDGDSSTEDDEIQADGCTCEGTPISSNCTTISDNCSNATVELCGNLLKVNLTSNAYYQITVNDVTTGWNVVETLCADWNPGDNCLAGLHQYTLPQAHQYSVQFTLDGSGTCSSSTFTVSGTRVNNTVDKAIEGLHLYPNPTSEILNISPIGNMTIEKLSIYAVSGVKMLEKQQDFSTIDMSPLPKGIYFLTFETDKGQMTKRVVKH